MRDIRAGVISRMFTFQGGATVEVEASARQAKPAAREDETAAAPTTKSKGRKKKRRRKRK